MADGVLDGKLALVAGVANKRSIAWAIAQALHGAGAELAFTYQGERLEEGVRKLAERGRVRRRRPCDVSADASIDRAFEQVGEEPRRARHLGRLDRVRTADTFDEPLHRDSRDGVRNGARHLRLLDDRDGRAGPSR